MRFLRSPVLPAKPKVLLIQTANPALTDYALDRVIDIHGLENVTFFKQQGMDIHLKHRNNLRVINNNKKNKAETAKSIRRMKFDLVYGIWSGETGFWKLKLLLFYSDPLLVNIFNDLALPT